MPSGPAKNSAPPRPLWERAVSLGEPASLAEPGEGEPGTTGCANRRRWRQTTLPHRLSIEADDVEAQRTLSYTWDFAHDDPAYDLKSVVTFTLTPTGTGTRLRMEQTGFRPEQKQALGGANAGWQQLLDRLAEVLAQPG